MKTCPKCSVSHDKPGTYCSRQCANSRGPRSEEFKLRVRNKLEGRTVSEEVKNKIRGNNHPKRRNKNLPESMTISCIECAASIKQRYVSQKFCNRQCWQEYSRKNRDAYTQYKFDCRFKFNVYDYPDWFDLTLINAHGWYSAANRGNNINGVSRDHKYSISEGFRQGISSVIISHPMNCELLLQSMNSKKKTKCSITLEELTEAIKKFEATGSGG